MAFIQKTVPPPNKVMNFSLKDFSGGMNNRSDQIADNEAAVVKNLMFADDTLLETRYGQKYFNDKVYDGAVIYIDEFKPYRGENELVVATETTMYIGDREIPLKGKPSGANHLGKYYFSDGETLKVYAKYHDDEEWKDEDRKTGKDDGTEKDKPKASEDTTYRKFIGTPIEGYEVYDVVSPKDGHTQLDTEHTQGVRVVNYTDKKVYYEPCKNEFEDNFKGACKVPEVVKYVVSHNGRLFVAGHDKDDDNVFITDLQNPLYYPVSLPLQIPPTSDKITGLHVFDDSVVVGREWDIYVISGSTNNPELGTEPFKLKKLNTHTGFASHSAVNIAHNYLIFLGSDGNVYAIQNTKTYERDLATTILSRTIDLNAYPIEVSKEDYPNATSFFYNDEWYLNIGNKTMVYNYRHMAWVMYEGLNATSCYGLNGEWIWGRPEGRIATFDKENFFDFGEPFQTLWYSKIFDMDDANSFKQFREFFLVAHTFDLHYSDVYVTFEIDYADVKDRVVISNQVSRWGFAKFGDRFISRRINESVPFSIGRRGRSIRFKITNNYDLDGVVDSYEELENYPAKREGLLVKLSSGGYYLYRNREWVLLEDKELNQRMKIYQINGDYELRGKR